MHNLRPTDVPQLCVIRQWDEDGYMWYEGGHGFTDSFKRAKRFVSPLEAWDVIAALRQAGYGRRDEGPSPNLSVQAA